MSSEEMDNQAGSLQIRGFRPDLLRATREEMPGGNTHRVAEDRVAYFTFMAALLIAMPRETRIEIIEHGKDLLRHHRIKGYPPIDHEKSQELLADLRDMLNDLDLGR